MLYYGCQQAAIGREHAFSESVKDPKSKSSFYKQYEKRV